MSQMQESEDVDIAGMEHLKIYELLVMLNDRDAFCHYLYSRDKGCIGVWYKPASHWMNMTREEAHQQLQFLLWLKGEMTEEEEVDVDSDSLLGRILDNMSDYRSAVDA